LISSLKLAFAQQIEAAFLAITYIIQHMIHLEPLQVEIRDGVVKERIFRSESHQIAYGFQIQFLRFHRLSAIEAYEYPQHKHSTFELILVETGPYQCLLNGQEVCVPAGHSLLIQPGDVHQDHLQPGQVHHVVQFGMQTVSREPPGLRIFKPGIPAVRQVTRMPSETEFHWLEEIAAETVGAPYSSNIQDALLEVMLWRMLRGFESDWLHPAFVQQTEAQTFAIAVLSLAASHLHQRYSVQALAHDLGLPEPTLHLRCKTILGATPSTLLRQIKIEHAQRLLLDGKMSVKQVAYELGFSSAFHFSQTFKQATGSAPSAWRSRWPDCAAGDRRGHHDERSPA
jgi:AraC-like DNA-binding protein